MSSIRIIQVITAIMGMPISKPMIEGDRLAGEKLKVPNVCPTVICHHGTEKDANASTSVRTPPARANQFRLLSRRLFNHRFFNRAGSNLIV